MSSKSDQREALWGEFVCSMELEDSDCTETLNRLENLGTEHATDTVRLATGQMLLAVRQGTGMDPGLFSAVHYLPKVDDPLIRSSFLHIWSSVLTTTGRYREALEATQQALEEAEQYRLTFVLPHAYIRRALALRGLRRFREALECLSQAQRERAVHDDHIGLSAEASRIGIHLARGELNEALKIPEPSLPAAATPNDVAELIATRALALACSKRLEEARDAASRALSLSSSAEPCLLARHAIVIAALQEEAPNGHDLIRDLLQEVERSGNVDAFVTAYRGFPRLLLEVALTGESKTRLAPILSAANDLKLGRAVLQEPPSSRLFGQFTLTAREQDVLLLIARGLRNRQIAEELFISEVTVKAHVRNILRKLGARSRTHAVSLANLSD